MDGIINVGGEMSGARDGRFLPHAVILGTAALALGWQLLFPGLYHIALDDALILPKYAPQMMQAFREGVVYPRWMPGDVGGYGSPMFVYYSPLLYVLAAVIGLAGLALAHSKLLIELLRLYLGAYFLFLLVRESRGEKAGYLAAFFYVLLPTRMLDLYAINSPASRFSQAFLPMSLYFAKAYVQGRYPRRGLLYAALPYTGLALSHLATAYIFTPLLFAWCALGMDRPRLKNVLKGSAIILAGLTLAASFFVPVLLERGHAQFAYMGRFVHQGNFILAPPQGLVHSDTETLRLKFSGSVVFEFGLALFLLYVAWKRGGYRPGREAVYFAGASAACFFMMSPLSAPVWDLLPGMGEVQFPGRFENLNLVFVSAVLGVAASALPSPGRMPKAFLALGAVLAVAILAADAKVILESKPFSEETAAAAARDAIFPEYLPKGVDPATAESLRAPGPKITFVDNVPMAKNVTDSSNAQAHGQPAGTGEDGRVEIKKWGSAERTFTVSTPGPATVRVRTFYFPGWRAYIDGGETGIRSEPKTGAILVDVPPGMHEVRLRFTDTWPRTVGAAITLVTFAVLLLNPLSRHLKI